MATDIWGRRMERHHIGGRAFDRAAAAVAVLGVVAVIAANLVVAWLHPTTGLIADTISNLAAGRYHWWLDAALALLRLGIVLLAFALWDMKLDAWRWKLGVLCIGLVGFGVAVIALWNEYGDGEPGGVTVHFEVVIAMGLLFTVGTVLLSLGLSRIGTFWSGLSVLTGVLWLAFGAWFFFSDDGWDGLIERVAAAMLVLWVLAMARLVGRERTPDPL